MTQVLSADRATDAGVAGRYTDRLSRLPRRSRCGAASALPGNIPIIAVSANTLADALERSNIRRRVIIISACFSGSWIPRLANDDTIIMTAASAYRTSFGCAEDRP